MSSKPRLLIIYDHFYPAFRAGGPVQSLANLVRALINEYDISVVTGIFDLNTTAPLKGVDENKWNDMILPGMDMPIKIWYAGKGKPGYRTYKKVYKEIKPAYIYMNGIFTPRFTLLPLLFNKTKIVICPRGMLHPGALQAHSLKKMLWLTLIKSAGLFDKVRWHATSADEKKDIQRLAGKHASIIIAGNIPRTPLNVITYPPKERGSLQLVYLSLIAEKKNLLLLINAINSISNKNISLDIYGPVKDANYWDRCQEGIKKGSNIFYKGVVAPDDVQSVFSKYHAFALFTKGENFSHALYECLSAGRPVITSHFTPWNDLKEQQAGRNISINDKSECLSVLNEFLEMDQHSLDVLCDGAYKLASSYFVRSEIPAYRELFSY